MIPPPRKRFCKGQRGCIGRYKKMKPQDTPGVLFFRHADKLHTARDAAPKGFIIAGADKKFYEGRAVLHGKHVVLRWPCGMHGPIIQK